MANGIQLEDPVLQSILQGLTQTTAPPPVSTTVPRARGADLASLILAAIGDAASTFARGRGAPIAPSNLFEQIQGRRRQETLIQSQQQREAAERQEAARIRGLEAAGRFRTAELEQKAAAESEAARRDEAQKERELREKIASDRLKSDKEIAELNSATDLAVKQLSADVAAGRARQEITEANEAAKSQIKLGIIDQLKNVRSGEEKRDPQALKEEIMLLAEAQLFGTAAEKRAALLDIELFFENSIGREFREKPEPEPPRQRLLPPAAPLGPLQRGVVPRRGESLLDDLLMGLFGPTPETGPVRPRSP